MKAHLWQDGLVDSFQFVSNLVSSLAWPATGLGLVIYLRTEVRGVAQALVKRIEDLKKLSAGAVSAEFEKAASEVAQKSDAIAEAVQQQAAPATETEKRPAEPALALERQDREERREQKVERLLEQDPRAVVLLEFIEIESSLTELFSARYGSRTPRTGFSKMLNQLVRDGVLDADVAGVLKDLAALRNELSHEPEATVTEEAARSYAEAASVAQKLLGIALLREGNRARSVSPSGRREG